MPENSWYVYERMAEPMVRVREDARIHGTYTRGPCGDAMGEDIPPTLHAKATPMSAVLGQEVCSVPLKVVFINAVPGERVWVRGWG
jgi:hypothetical protein